MQALVKKIVYSFRNRPGPGRGGERGAWACEPLWSTRKIASDRSWRDERDTENVFHFVLTPCGAMDVPNFFLCFVSHNCWILQWKSMKPSSFSYSSISSLHNFEPLLYQIFVLNLLINNMSSKNALSCDKNRPRSYYAVNNCKKIFAEVFVVAEYDSAVKI